jgi:hypothetical protein
LSADSTFLKGKGAEMNSYDIEMQMRLQEGTVPPIIKAENGDWVPESIYWRRMREQHRDDWRVEWYKAYGLNIEECKKADSKRITQRLATIALFKKVVDIYDEWYTFKEEFDRKLRTILAERGDTNNVEHL